LATCVVHLSKHVRSYLESPTCQHLDRITYIRFARVAADLGKEQVDTEWRVGVFQILFQGFDLVCASSS
jgi:hypothetical protein